MPTRAQFGERLRIERLRLGYTQEQFARLAGLRRETQHLYEVGSSSPTVDYLDTIGRVGADVRFLVAGERRVVGRKGATPRFTRLQIGMIHMHVTAARNQIREPLSRPKLERLLDAACEMVMASPGLTEESSAWSQLRLVARALR